MDNYSLFQSSLLTKLLDRDFFINAIDRRIFQEARRYHCITKCSRRRIMQAQTYAFEDVDRVLHEAMPVGTETLDHFKIGAYVGFWVRRMVPINSIQFSSNLKQHNERARGNFASVTGEQEFFALYGNEIAAFNIAYDIAFHGETSRWKNEGEEVSAFLQKFESTGLVPTSRTIKEIVVTLKHKHNSPHTLYTTLISLFDGLDTPRR